MKYVFAICFCTCQTCIFKNSALRLPPIRSKSSVLAKQEPRTEALSRGFSKKTLFCTVFILDFAGTFDLMEKQMKKCDDYAFLSTFNDEKRKVVKVLEKAPKSSQLNWPIAEAITTFWSSKAKQFDWFLKVDPDCFLRPNQMRASLAQYSSEKPIAVGRPGRHGKIPLVGAVFALSNEMVKQLQNKHLDAAQLAKGTWHSEDTVMSAWIPHAGGIIENAVNADHGCTTFSSTDREEVPTTQDIKLMKSGKSYTKGKMFTKKANWDFGDICYSPDLAAIHPVKSVAAMKELIDQLDL